MANSGKPEFLWGGVGGGGRCWRTRLAQQLRPPPRPPSLRSGAKPMLRIGVLGVKNGGRRPPIPPHKGEGRSALCGRRVKADRVCCQPPHDEDRTLCVARRCASLRMQPYCFGPTVDSDQSVDADPSTRGKSRSMDRNGAEAGLCWSFFCRSFGSTLDDRSVGFSTRRDDPSNNEFSSIDNDR